MLRQGWLGREDFYRDKIGQGKEKLCRDKAFLCCNKVGQNREKLCRDRAGHDRGALSPMTELGAHDRQAHATRMCAR